MKELDREGFEQAISGPRPAVVDFWAGWCMPCKIFAPVMEDVARALGSKVDFYKVNIDEYSDLAEKYEVSSIPTVILFKDGQEVGQMIGVRSKDDVIEMIEKVL